MMNNEQCLQATRYLWDEAAATFDNEPDHGLRDPLVRRAWIEQISAGFRPPRLPSLTSGAARGHLVLSLLNLGTK